MKKSVFTTFFISLFLSLLCFVSIISFAAVDSTPTGGGSRTFEPGQPSPTPVSVSLPGSSSSPVTTPTSTPDSTGPASPPMGPPPVPADSWEHINPDTYINNYWIIYDLLDPSNTVRTQIYPVGKELTHTFDKIGTYKIEVYRAKYEHHYAKVTKYSIYSSGKWPNISWNIIASAPVNTVCEHSLLRPVGTKNVVGSNGRVIASIPSGSPKSVYSGYGGASYSANVYPETDVWLQREWKVIVPEAPYTWSSNMGDQNIKPDVDGYLDK